MTSRWQDWQQTFLSAEYKVLFFGCYLKRVMPSAGGEEGMFIIFLEIRYSAHISVHCVFSFSFKATLK